MSIWPKQSSVFLSRALTDAASDTSAPAPSASGAKVRANSRHLSSSRSLTTTFAPASARAQQCSFPSRPSDPVTTATLPFSENRFILKTGSLPSPLFWFSVEIACSPEYGLHRLAPQVLQY